MQNIQYDRYYNAHKYITITVEYLLEHMQPN